MAEYLQDPTFHIPTQAEAASATSVMPAGNTLLFPGHNFAPGEENPLANLSPTSYEVFVSAWQGHLVKEVGPALGLSTKVVDEHFRTIFKTIGQSSHEVAYGLIPIDERELRSMPVDNLERRVGETFRRASEGKDRKLIAFESFRTFETINAHYKSIGNTFGIRPLDVRRMSIGLKHLAAYDEMALSVKSDMEPKIKAKLGETAAAESRGEIDLGGAVVTTVGHPKTLWLLHLGGYLTPQAAQPEDKFEPIPQPVDVKGLLTALLINRDENIPVMTDPLRARVVKALIDSEVDSFLRHGIT